MIEHLHDLRRDLRCVGTQILSITYDSCGVTCDSSIFL
jgi:hypothetical protein